jgi:DNA-binding ferritin-like protein
MRPEQTEQDATFEQQNARTAQPVDDTGDEPRERLVPEDRAASYGSRWDAVKGTFVDEPREAVAQADALVGELLDELETLFREQRRTIEQGLDADDTSTEDLRLALRRYRSFFDRLLAV